MKNDDGRFDVFCVSDLDCGLCCDIVLLTARGEEEGCE